MIEKVSLDEIKKDVSSEKSVALYFYSDTCAPCRSLRPKLITLMEEQFPNIKLLFVNSLEHPSINTFYGVYANPCLLVFFEGKEYIRKSIYMSISELQEEIQRLYKMVFE